MKTIPFWAILPFFLEVVEEYQVSVDLNYGFQDRMCDQRLDIWVLYLPDPLGLGDLELHQEPLVDVELLS